MKNDKNKKSPNGSKIPFTLAPKYVSPQIQSGWEYHCHNLHNKTWGINQHCAAFLPKRLRKIATPTQSHPSHWEKANTESSYASNILTAQPMRITARTKSTTFSKHKH